MWKEKKNQNWGEGQWTMIHTWQILYQLNEELQRQQRPGEESRVGGKWVGSCTTPCSVIGWELPQELDLSCCHVTHCLTLPSDELDFSWRQSANDRTFSWVVSPLLKGDLSLSQNLLQQFFCWIISSNIFVY